MVVCCVIRSKPKDAPQTAHPLTSSPLTTCTRQSYGQVRVQHARI